MRKRLAYLVLGVALATSLFGGCGKETSFTTDENTKEESVTDENAEESVNKEEKIEVFGNGSKVIRCDKMLYFLENEQLYKCDISSSTETKSFSNIEGYEHLMADKTLLLEVKDKVIKGLHLVDEWIYFADKDGISKIKTDGTELTCISERDNTGIQEIYRGYIYYFLRKGDILSINRMKLDGTDDVCIEKNVEQLYATKIVNNNIFIYVNDGVYKINSDTAVTECVLELADMDSVCFDDDYAYIHDYETGFIHKMRKDGTNAEIILEIDDYRNLELKLVANGWIYFEGKINKNSDRFWRVSDDGKELQETMHYSGSINLQTIDKEQLLYTNDSIYLINEDNSLSKKERIEGAIRNYFGSIIRVDNNYIYCFKDNDSKDDCWYVIDINEKKYFDTSSN